MIDVVMLRYACKSQEARLERLFLICRNPAFRYLKAILWCSVGNLHSGKE